MKILQLISTLDPANGGPVEGLRQMAKALQNLGHCVEVATLDGEDAPWLAEFPFKVHAFGAGLLRYGFNAKLIPWLRDYADNYDALIVNGIWQYHSFATWRALRKTKVPYFVYTHGMMDPWFKRAYPLKHVKNGCIGLGRSTTC